AIHQVAVQIAGLAGYDEDACFRGVKRTNTLEDCFDRAIDTEARVRKDSHVFEQLQAVFELRVITAPTRNDVAKDQQTDRREQQPVETNRFAARKDHADDRVDRRRGECQSQSVSHSPAKRGDDDREEEEVIEAAVDVRRISDEWYIPQQVEPRDDFVGNDRIAPNGQVIDQ